MSIFILYPNQKQYQFSQNDSLEVKDYHQGKFHNSITRSTIQFSQITQINNFIYIPVNSTILDEKSEI